MPTLPPLIGLAHGSRDPRAAVEIAAVMAAVAALRPGLITVSAFLDLTEPDLTSAVRTLPPGPAVVVPLLFTAAFHTRVDTPQAVRRAGLAIGQELITAAHLGTGPEVLTALQARAEQSGLAPEAEILLLAVGSSDAAANAAVIELADRWAMVRGRPVRATFATVPPRIEAELTYGFRGAVVPLFLAAGLLLDAASRLAAGLGVPVAAPLGPLVAQLVLDRYDDAVRQRWSPA